VTLVAVVALLLLPLLPLLLLRVPVPANRSTGHRPVSNQTCPSIQVPMRERHANADLSDMCPTNTAL